jgi:hypothetical protein
MANYAYFFFLGACLGGWIKSACLIIEAQRLAWLPSTLVQTGTITPLWAEILVMPDAIVESEGINGVSLIFIFLKEEPLSVEYDK